YAGIQPRRRAARYLGQTAQINGRAGAMGMVDWDECAGRLDAGVRALEIKVPKAARALLIDYLRELTTWNATYNLTAVRDPLAMVTRHVLDCLAIVPFVSGGNVADVGSGAGLPGIVLAIARPKLDVVMIESSRKKAAFLRHVRRRLALPNITVVQQRVEQYTPDTRFDIVTCRAFASAGDAARLAGHLIAPGGRVLLMKGRDPAAELAELPLDFQAVDTVALAVPGLSAERHLAILEPGLI